MTRSRWYDTKPIRRCKAPTTIQVLELGMEDPETKLKTDPPDLVSRWDSSWTKRTSIPAKRNSKPTMTSLGANAINVDGEKVFIERSFASEILEMAPKQVFFAEVQLFIQRRDFKTKEFSSRLVSSRLHRVERVAHQRKKTLWHRKSLISTTTTTTTHSAATATSGSAMIKTTSSLLSTTWL